MYTSIKDLVDAHIKAAQSNDTTPPNSPATTREIEALSAHIEAPLPDEYIELLSLTNGWVDLQGTNDIHEVTLLSCDEITSGAYDEEIEDIADDAMEESGYTGVFPVMFVHDEDSVIVLLVKDGKAYMADAHLGAPDEPQPLLELLNYYLAAVQQ